jgi:hypothetical protein
MGGILAIFVSPKERNARPLADRFLKMGKQPTLLKITNKELSLYSIVFAYKKRPKNGAERTNIRIKQQPICVVPYSAR